MIGIVLVVFNFRLLERLVRNNLDWLMCSVNIEFLELKGVLFIVLKVDVLL